ncbi:MAG TPA: hypothetical protein VKV32_05630 [Stellaceae bacterium]|nr:hypothetical protein [Stellaceae bacterium]
MTVIDAQVKEARDRQALGFLPAGIDPKHRRLAAFVLVSYSRMLPPIACMTTGQTADDPRFVAAWERLPLSVGTSREEHAQREHVAARNC